MKSFNKLNNRVNEGILSSIWRSFSRDAARGAEKKAIGNLSGHVFSDIEKGAIKDAERQIGKQELKSIGTESAKNYSRNLKTTASNYSKKLMGLLFSGSGKEGLTSGRRKIVPKFSSVKSILKLIFKISAIGGGAVVGLNTYKNLSIENNLKNQDKHLLDNIDLIVKGINNNSVLIKDLEICTILTLFGITIDDFPKDDKFNNIINSNDTVSKCINHICNACINQSYNWVNSQSGKSILIKNSKIYNGILDGSYDMSKYDISLLKEELININNAYDKMNYWFVNNFANIAERDSETIVISESRWDQLANEINSDKVYDSTERGKSTKANNFLIWLDRVVSEHGIFETLQQFDYKNLNTNMNILESLIKIEENTYVESSKIYSELLLDIHVHFDNFYKMSSSPFWPAIYEDTLWSNIQKSILMMGLLIDISKKYINNNSNI